MQRAFEALIKYIDLRVFSLSILRYALVWIEGERKKRKRKHKRYLHIFITWQLSGIDEVPFFFRLPFRPTWMLCYLKSLIMLDWWSAISMRTNLWHSHFIKNNQCVLNSITIWFCILFYSVFVLFVLFWC